MATARYILKRSNNSILRGCLGLRANYSTGEERPSVLPRTRSVDQAHVDVGGIARSPDAPADPLDKQNRDTHGMSEQEVDKQVKEAVSRGGARSSEALGGRADMLRANPSWHMNQVDKGGKKGGIAINNEHAEMANVGSSSSDSHDSSKDGSGPHAFGDWADGVVGNGVKETVKQGASKVSESLKRMFKMSEGAEAEAAAHARVPGGGGAVRRDDAKGQLHGSRGMVGDSRDSRP